MATDIWFLIAIGISLMGYGRYIIGLRRNAVQPDRASWLIWSAAATIGAVTYLPPHASALQSWMFVPAAMGCIAIAVTAWRRSNRTSPTSLEACRILAAVTALILWLALPGNAWASMLVAAAIPVSFLPIWTRKRFDESSAPWGLWALANVATVIIAANADGTARTDLGFIVMGFVCHAGTWLIFRSRTTDPLWLPGFLSLDRYRHNRNLFAIGDNHLGKAVYARCRFAEGAELMRIAGAQFGADRMRGSDDRRTARLPDHLLRPARRLYDLINHSCDPNAGMRFTDDGAVLVAIRDIFAGDEISWDYSTTLAQSDWHMICQCRSVPCRRVIGSFDTLDPDRQAFYRARNLVSPDLRRRDSVGPARRLG